jgi:hypothetical protein
MATPPNKRMSLLHRGDHKLAPSPTHCYLVALVVASWVAHPVKLLSQTHRIRPVPADTVSGTESQRIWEAVLRFYRARSGPTEADFVRETDSIVRGNRDTTRRDEPSLVLFGTPNQRFATYDTVWLHTLVRRGLVSGFCLARYAEQCGDTVLTTYLAISQPTRLRGDTIWVRTDEAVLNPAECRMHQAFVGGWQRAWLLVQRDGVWRVVGPDRFSETSSSGLCGTPPPEVVARMREDSLLRSIVSPIAGTYRFTVTLSTGDSTRVYSRTEMKPMESLRGWKRDDPNTLPIAGYYVMAVCALDERTLPKRYTNAHSITGCYHSVSVQPVYQDRDSSIFRGDPEAGDAAALLLWEKPFKQDLYPDLNGDYRDSSAYYMPGFWTVYANGRVRFEWVIRNAGRVLVTVRGERISSATLLGHSQ